MRRTILFLIVIFCLMPFFTAFSEEGKWEGEVSVTGKYYDVTGEKAKYYEYKDFENVDDLGDVAIKGDVKLKYDSPSYQMEFKTKDPGYDTQEYRLEGGAYGKFKYNIDYNEIIHNTTFDARTPYSGAGGGVLGGVPNTDINSWNTFDYDTQRKRFGTGLKFDLLKPFFFDVSYDYEKKEGIKPLGHSDGIGIELPEPVDYRTDSFKVEAGYARNPLFLSVGYFFNNFRNKEQELAFYDPGTGGPNTVGLAPDSKQDKWAAKGYLKLPYKSKFAVNIWEATTNSDSDVFPEFDGKVDTKNYDLSLSSNPLKWFDAKAYYKYYKRENKSEDPTAAVEEFFNYNKQTYGVDLGIRLPQKFYLTGGYKYIRMKRDRSTPDGTERLPYNKDNVYNVDLKWSGLPCITPKTGYEYLNRSHEYNGTDFPETRVINFIYGAKRRDTFKIGVDLFPKDDLNFGLEYKYKKADYNDTDLGLTDDKRHEFYFTGDYVVTKRIKLAGYFDYEKINYDQTQRTGDSWEFEQKEDTYSYGVRADIGLIPKKLMLVIEHDYVDSNGSGDFSGSSTALSGYSPSTLNLSKWDDYRRWSLKVKTTYICTKALSFDVGYAYERYRYNDAQYDGYRYVNSTATAGYYLTGALADPNYTANVYWLSMTYKFD